MFEFERTDIASLAPEIAPLLQANWKERHADMPRYALEPNLTIYCDAEASGFLYLFTARKDGQLIGYAIVFAMQRPHAASELVGAVDTLYVLPEHRANGVASRLLACAENQLREAGVKTMTVGVNDPRIIRWLRMTSGYSYAETLLEKVL